MSQDDYTAKRVGAMLGKATTVGRKTVPSRQLSPALSKGVDIPVRSAPEAAAQLGKGSGRGNTQACQQVGPAPRLDRPSAAGVPRAKSATGGGDDVVSLMSSAQTSRACELSQDDEDDKVVTLTSRSSSGSPVAGAQLEASCCQLCTSSLG